MGVEKLIPGVAQAEAAGHVGLWLFRSRAGQLALGGLAGGAIVALGGINGVYGVEQTVSASGGHGEVTDVRAILPEECHAAYTSNIQNAQAEYNVQLTGDLGPIHLKVPTGISDREDFSGNITSKVCSKPLDYTISVDPSNGTAEADIPASAFITTVYQTDMTVNPYHTVQNGPTEWIAKALEDGAKTLPGVNFNGKAEDMVGKLRGYAFLSAQSTQAEACGSAAWPALKPIINKALQESLAKDADIQVPMVKAGKEPLRPDQIKIKLPDNIAFTTQYTDQLNGLKGQLKNDHVTLNAPKAGTCEMSPELKQKTAELQSSANTSTGPTVNG